jgi:hypothetical protein
LAYLRAELTSQEAVIDTNTNSRIKQRKKQDEAKPV